MINCLWVGIGGFIGSCLRYLFGQIPVFENLNFPLSTLLINFIGAFLIGLISQTSTNFNFNLFFKVGLCGGFTTFSTFSLETFTMIESGKMFLAIIYSLASVLLCLAGILVGKLVAKLVFKF